MTRWRQALPVLLGVQAFLGLVALAWGSLRGVAWWQEVALTPGVLLALGAGVALSLASTLLFEIASRMRLAQADWLLDEFLGPLFRGLPVGWAVALALLSGWCEESFFRGVVQAEFGLWPASVMFGVLHTGDRRLLVAGLWSTAVGLGLGLAYQATGNLAVPMAVHAASNFMSFVHLSRWRPPE